LNINHASLDAAGAEKVPADGTELDESASGVDLIEHGRHERAFEISAGRRRLGFEQSSMHVPQLIPAWLLGGLEANRIRDGVPCPNPNGLAAGTSIQ
jgi:hypothetical protein